ncbi:Rne/Rng family ribonuclease [Fictibacillus aquaticus]|uniref:S1 motif domain-containing protein n=1 Tax=Fictibacillus aquaticus TaxID=2021314 RepID=A0A235FAS0_9BACL|nr:Rne/Rng family ribonuclease [Fictibacillus aquaticus]OYD58063.1 hypothetical protein CGZ90_09260 [Fictibacillus aquaticus]
MHHILIEARGIEKRIALLKNKVLLECHIFRPDNHPKSGQVYKGRVQKVLPGMQAAFIDIGMEKNGFIHRDEIPAFQEMSKEKQKNSSVSHLVRQGEEIIVQVIKEENSEKGARLTGILSYSGQNLVYFPTGSYIGVSKKMSETEREDWREWGESAKHGSEGMVLRTSCAAAGKEAVLDELNELRQRHQELLNAAGQKKTPSLIKDEPFYVPLLKKWSSIESEITVDDTAILKQIKELHTGSVNLHRGHEMLFEHWNIETELVNAGNPQVHLKNGASLVFDHTEALTVIDVNSAKFTGKSDRQKTVLHVNLAAAEEIARQLRLRGIGGMIVIDFITMTSKEDQLKVTERMKALMKEDPVTTNLHGFSAMGVFEMTRKKERPPLRQFLPVQKSENTDERERQHNEALFFQLDRNIRSLQFDESEAIWFELPSSLLALGKEAVYKLIINQWLEEMPFKLYLTERVGAASFSLRHKGTIAEIEKRISNE